MAGTVPARVCLLALAAAALAGCARTESDERWVFDAIEPGLAREQAIGIVCDPPADLFVTAPGDGAERFAGRTPCSVTCRYAVAEVRLHRATHRTWFGIFRRETGRETRVEEVVQGASYLLRLTADRCASRVVPLDVPRPTHAFAVALEPSGAVKNIAAVLEIEARKEYFAEIEPVIASFERRGSPEGVKREHPEPVPTVKDLFAQTYTLVVEDSPRFDALVGALKDLATTKRFVFDVYDASLGAKFSSNVMNTEIEHIVRGRVRPGSELFVVRSGRIEKKSTDPQTGAFSFSAAIHPEEQFVYFISRFRIGKATLAVYKRMNVFTREEEEIGTAEEFCTVAGIEPAALEGLGP
jgi:hypothetical protein